MNKVASIPQHSSLFPIWLVTIVETPKCFAIKNKENIAKSQKEKKEQEQKEKESTATNGSDNKEKAKERQMLKLTKAFVAISKPADNTDDEFN